MSEAPAAKACGASNGPKPTTAGGSHRRTRVLEGRGLEGSGVEEPRIEPLSAGRRTDLNESEVDLFKCRQIHHVGISNRHQWWDMKVLRWFNRLLSSGP